MLTCKSPRKVMRAAYLLAKDVLPAQSSRFSRHDFTLPQLFACLVLREHQRRSYRGIEALLLDSRHWCWSETETQLVDIGAVTVQCSVQAGGWRAYAKTNAGGSRGHQRFGQGESGEHFHRDLALPYANNYTGSTTLNAGTLSVRASGALGTGTLSVYGGVLDLQVTRAITGGSMYFYGGTLSEATANAISGSARLILQGGSSAVVPLAYANDYTGGTYVYGGTLLANGTSGSSTGTGTVAVNGGTLGGTGSIGRPVTVNTGGTISPGDSSGGVLSTGNLSLTSAGRFSLDVSGATPRRVSVAGTVSLSGANLLVVGARSSHSGDELTLISNDGTDAVSGGFANLAEGSSIVAGGVEYRVSYVGGDGNDVTLTDTGRVISTISATIQTDGLVQLNWSVNVADGGVVERSADDGMQWAAIAWGIEGTGSIVDKTVSAHQSYEYRVRSVVGADAWQSARATVTTGDISAEQPVAIHWREGQNVNYELTIPVDVNVVDTRSPGSVYPCFSTLISSSLSVWVTKDGSDIASTMIDPLDGRWQVTTDGAGNPAVNVTVSFAADDDGTYTVHGLVQKEEWHSGGYVKVYTTGTVNKDVAVENVAPGNVSLHLTPATLHVGDATVLQGSFTDPGALDTHSVVVDWGDGSAVTTLDLSAGLTEFATPAHQYADLGSYDIGVTVTDKDGDAIWSSLTANVSEAMAAGVASDPVTGTGTTLYVSGVQSTGMVNPTYTWWVQSKPVGAPDPTFDANGTPDAQYTWVTFFQAGDYSFGVRVSDGVNVVTDDVVAHVQQVAGAITVTPDTVTLHHNGSRQFSAAVVDQFGLSMSAEGAIIWSLDAGSIGTIDQTGAYHAGDVSGTAMVRVTSGDVNGAAQVIVTMAPPVLTAVTVSADPLTMQTATMAATATNGGDEQYLRYTWSCTAKPDGADDPAFSVNGDNAAGSTIVTFYQNGYYAFAVTVSDGADSATQNVSVTVSMPFTALASGLSTATAGQPYTLSLNATGVGAGSVTSWSIDWGDGSAVQLVSGGASASVPHVFDGATPVPGIVVSATDGSFTYTAKPFFVGINADTPVLTVGGDTTVAVGVAYTLNLSFLYSAGSSSSVSEWWIDWGDGFSDAPDAQSLAGNITSITHIFAPGVTQAQVSVTAVDAAYCYDADPWTVTVTGVLPPATVTGTATTVYSSSEVDLSWSQPEGDARGFDIYRSGTKIATVEGNQYTYADVGLSAETSYQYEVVATNAAGSASGATAMSATTAPSVLSTSSITRDPITGRATLRWASQGTRVVGYEIEMKDGAGDFCYVGTALGNATSWTTAYMDPVEGYSFRVRAKFNNGDVSDYSAAAPMTFDTSVLPPAAQNLQLSQAQDGSVRLSFTVPSFDTSRYSGAVVLVEVSSPDAPGGWVTEFPDGGSHGAGEAVTEALDVGLWPTSVKARVMLRYSVTSDSVYVSSPYSSTDLELKSSVNVPSGFRTTGITRGSDTTEIRVAWDRQEGVSTQVMLARNATYNGMIAPTAAGDGWAPFTLTGSSFTGDVVPVAWNAPTVGGQSSLFAVGDKVVANPLLGAPTNVAARAFVKKSGSTGVRITWSNTADEAGYRIYRSADGGQTWKQIGSVGADETKYTDSGAEVDVHYQYRVVAYCGSAQSSFSNAASATVNRVTVYYWEPKFGSFGHLAIMFDDGTTYASWWPKTHSVSAPHYPNDTLERDSSIESFQPQAFVIAGLDDQTMKIEWLTFAWMHDLWQLFGWNCTTLTRHLLEVGGATFNRRFFLPPMIHQPCDMFRQLQRLSGESLEP